MSKNVRKEFMDLPTELQMWGMTAISKLTAPEKQANAASALRKKMDDLMEQCPLESVSQKTEYVLYQLGDAEKMSQKLLEESTNDPNGRKKDIIFGISFILIGALLCLYAISIFIGPYSLFDPGWYDYSIATTGKNAGAGAAAGLFMLVIGVCILSKPKK